MKMMLAVSLLAATVAAALAAQEPPRPQSQRLVPPTRLAAESESQPPAGPAKPEAPEFERGELTVRVPVDVPHGQAVTSIELPAIDLSKVDPHAVRSRLNAWRAQNPWGPAPRLSQLADADSTKVQRVASSSPDWVVVFKAWTIGGMPFFESSLEYQGKPVQGQAAVSHATAQAFGGPYRASAFPGFGPSGTSVGVSVSQGPDGRAHVTESYGGQAAVAQGTVGRSYVLPGQQGASVQAYSTPQGTRVYRTPQGVLPQPTLPQPTRQYPR